MKRKLPFLALMALVLVFGLSGIAQDPQPDPKQPPESPDDANTVVEEMSPPEALDLGSDEAFRAFVDLRLLPQAIATRDSGLAADLALQVAEGERVLHRPHTVLPAARFFPLVVRMATETRDVKTLDRLAAAARRDQNRELEERIAAVRPLLAIPRATRPPLQFTEEELENGAFDSYRELLRQVEAARVIGDRPALEAFKADQFEAMGNDPGAKARARLLELVDEALQALPEKMADPELLAKLQDAARGSDTEEAPEADRPVPFAGAFLTQQGLPARLRSGIWNSVGYDLARRCFIHAGRGTSEQLRYSSINNQRIFSFSRSRLGYRVGRGQCGDLNYHAIKNLINKDFGFYGSPVRDDYRWGRLVGSFTPGNWRVIQYVHPGDLLQFRNAQFSGSYRYKTSTYTWRTTATHHSAVVLAKGANFVNTFEQNSGGRLYVTQGLCYFPAMKSGTVWVYRPQGAGGYPR